MVRIVVLRSRAISALDLPTSARSTTSRSASLSGRRTSGDGPARTAYSSLPTVSRISRWLTDTSCSRRYPRGQRREQNLNELDAGSDAELSRRAAQPRRHGRLRHAELVGDELVRVSEHRACRDL